MPLGSEAPIIGIPLNSRGICGVLHMVTYPLGCVTYCDISQKGMSQDLGCSYVLETVISPPDQEPQGWIHPGSSQDPALGFPDLEVKSQFPAHKSTPGPGTWGALTPETGISPQTVIPPQTGGSTSKGGFHSKQGGKWDFSPLRKWDFSPLRFPPQKVDFTPNRDFT